MICRHLQSYGVDVESHYYDTVRVKGHKILEIQKHEVKQFYSFMAKIMNVTWYLNSGQYWTLMVIELLFTIPHILYMCAIM